MPPIAMPPSLNTVYAVVRNIGDERKSEQEIFISALIDMTTQYLGMYSCVVERFTAAKAARDQKIILKLIDSLKEASGKTPKIEAKFKKVIDLAERVEATLDIYSSPKLAHAIAEFHHARKKGKSKPGIEWKKGLTL